MSTLPKLFLIDAYALIYRSYYAFIKNPRINSKGQNTSAILGFVNTLEELLSKEKPAYVGVAFDPGGPTFRHEAYPQYKAQREKTPEDIRFAVPYIKDILRAYRIPLLEVPGFEADDVIGTLATTAGRQELDVYMVTPDKDYGQLVSERVRMYRPRHTGGFEVMGPEEVKQKYGLADTGQVIDLLGLMGDSSDNIPGCPGVGEKTAQRLLADYGSIDGLLAHVDDLRGALKKKVEEHREEIVFSRFLATIRTDVPISLNLDELSVKTPDMGSLRRIFDELEFRTLLRKLTDRLSPTPTPATPQAMQLDLFAPMESAEGPAGSPDSGSAKGQMLEENATDGTENRSVRTLKAFDETECDYQLIQTEEERQQILQYLLTKTTFAFDTETTDVEPMRAELVGMSFSAEPGKAYYVAVPPQRAEAQQIVDMFRPLLENPAVVKVGQNIKYDMIVLRRYGVRVAGPLFDTMLAHYVLQPEQRHNMDYLAETYLGYRTIHIDELIGPRGKAQKNMRDLTPAEVYRYAAEDADVTLKLKDVLEKEVRRAGAEQLFREVEMPLVPVLVEMEVNGVRIDSEALKQTSELFSVRLAQIEEEIYKLSDQRFNIASPKQVGEVLFDHLHIAEKPKKTKTGNYVTNEEVLESLRGRHPVVGLILDHRGLKKLLGTYVDALPLLVNRETQRVHTSFNQAVTATGRLSSSNPNLQNIPVRDEDGKEIRKAFIPDDGCLFFSADYSQVELRIMAHLSRDPNLIEAFLSDQDIHAATAAKVFNTTIDEVTREMRRKAKTANFGIIYGISAFGLAERMNVSRREARELIDGYFSTYPGVKAYMDKSIAQAREKGYVETIFGRRRYLPDINSRNATVRGYAERNAINAPIQGSAADIIKVAMARIHQRFEAEGLKSKMLLQVHDELNFSVPQSEREAVEAIVVAEMENAVKLLVPLKVDGGWGDNWLQAH